MLQSNEKYIVSYKEAFRVFKKAKLEPLKTHPAENVKTFQLFKEFIIYCTNTQIYQFNIQKETTKEIAKAVGSCKITALFVNDGFIYVGHSNGIVNVFNFNETHVRLTQTIEHKLPINNLISDNINIYITDPRDKVCVYPEGFVYEYNTPRLFFKRYPYVLSEKKLYALSPKAPLFLFEFSKEIDGDLQFSPGGGIIFARHGKSSSGYNMMGNQLTNFLQKNYTVIERNGHCTVVVDEDRPLETQIWVKDTEPMDLTFSEAAITEKIITAEEHEMKFAYVDNGNKNSIKRNKVNTLDKSWNKKHTSAGSDSYNSGDLFEEEPEIKTEKYKPFPVETTLKEYKQEKNTKSNGANSRVIVESDDSSIQEFTATAENLTNTQNQIKQNMPPQVTSEFFNPLLTLKNPSSYENTQGNLLFYSFQGFMLSIEAELCNHVYIKYHEREIEPIDFRDTLKCKLGAFYAENYVISDGNCVHFSGLWKKDIKCSLLGINRNSIFVFYACFLSIFDYTGVLIDCLYIKDVYTFCAGENQLAVFCKDFLMLIKNVDKPTRTVDYIPVAPVEFACFDGSELFLKIGNNLFVLVNKILKYVCEINERILTVFGNNCLTLEDNTMLPKPKVRYHQIREDECDQNTFDMSILGQYKPSKY